MKHMIFMSALLFFLLCGCDKEEVHTEFTGLREIGKLTLCKVQWADLLTGGDDDVEVKYIAYTDALICVDFEKVKIVKSTSTSGAGNGMDVYEVEFPEFTVERPRVIHGEKYSRPWSAKAKWNKSISKVETQLRIAAENRIKDEARKEEHMKRARKAAEEVVRTMIEAKGGNARIEFK